MNKKVRLIFPILFFSLVLNAQKTIQLWPKGKMPNSKGLTLEHIEKQERITQVSEPKLLAFFPSKEEQNGSSILILPSGGYQKLSYNLGGIQLAKWYNTQGITAFVLLYRLPNSPDLLISENGPIQDTQRAMKLIRFNAEKWNLSSNKIGIFGSSAGGHLATTIANHPKDLSKIKDKLDVYSFHPDYMILVSPVISFEKYTHQGSLKNFLGDHATKDNIYKYSNEFHVSEKTPPTVLFHAQNDQAVNCMNSILYYQAMLKNDVKGSLHVFPKGGHKIGIYNASDVTELWKTISTNWLKEINIISKN